MPYIHVNVSPELTTEKETKIKEKLGAIIELIPGKAESFLMVQLQGGCHLHFGGNQQAETAYVKVEVFGQITDECSKKLTEEICRLLEQELGIPGNRTYVTYEGISQWGWNGDNF